MHSVERFHSPKNIRELRTASIVHHDDCGRALFQQIFYQRRQQHAGFVGGNNDRHFWSSGLHITSSRRPDTPPSESPPELSQARVVLSSGSGGPRWILLRTLRYRTVIRTLIEIR